VKNAIKIGKMKLSEAQARLLISAVELRVQHLKIVVAAWEALPDDAIVNNLERHLVNLAKEDIPNLQTILTTLKEAL
jgi:hypothetical protein